MRRCTALAGADEGEDQRRAAAVEFGCINVNPLYASGAVSFVLVDGDNPPAGQVIGVDEVRVELSAG